MSAPRSYLEQLERALDELSDFAAIERAGQMLSSDVYGTLVPVGGTHDLGRDGVALVLGDQVHHLVLAISAQQDWKRKIRRVVDRIREVGEPMDVLVYCTPGVVRDDAEFQQLREELRAEGVRLEPPLGRAWWLDRLTKETPAARSIRRDILRIPFHPGHFRTANEFEEQFSRQRGVVVGELVSREDALAAIASALDEAPIVILHGDRGLGKTRIAIEAARRADARFITPTTHGKEPTLIDDLATLDSDTVVVDDAHARPELVRALVQASLDPQLGRPRHVMLVTWSSTLPSVRALVGHAAEIREVALGPLAREDLSRILQSPPINLADGRLRAAVLDASGGYPLFAIMGAFALAGGADPTRLGTNPLEAYFASFWDRMPSRPQARILALAAIVGHLRVVDEMGAVTEYGEEVATKLELTPDELWDELSSLAESGLLSIEDGAHVLRPDALARIVIKRMCFGNPPLADIRVLLELGAAQWDRALPLLIDIYEETNDRRIQQAVRGLLEETVPAEGADAQVWSTFLRYALAAAILLPEDVVRWALTALSRDIPPASQGFLGYTMDRVDVRRTAVQIAERVKYRDLKAAIGLLLTIASEEPFEHHNAGISQRNAPAIHALLELAGLIDPNERQSGVPIYVRQTTLDVVAPWWREEPLARADLVVLVLGGLLDPALGGAFADPDKPHTVNLLAVQMGADAYRSTAELIVTELIAALAHAGDRGARAVFATIDDVVGTARGHPRSFDQRPTQELSAVAQDVACRVLKAVRERFAGQIAIQLRARELEDEAGCRDPAPLPGGADEIKTLFTWDHGADRDESEKRKASGIADILARLRGRSADEITDWYIARARSAVEAGYRETQYSAELLREIGRERGDVAIPVARALAKQSDVGGYAAALLIDPFERDPAELDPVLREWLAGPERERRSAWSFLNQNPDGIFQRAPALVADAIAAATDEDADAVELFVLRMAGRAGDSPVLGLTLRSKAAMLQRIGVAFSCLLPAAARHSHHITLAGADRVAFENALVAGMRLPMSHNGPQILLVTEDTMKELAELEPALMSRWLRERLAALAEPTEHYTEPFAPGERVGLQHLRGKADIDGLLDDYLALDTAGVAESEGWEFVMRTAIPDPFAAVLKRLQLGGLEYKGALRLLSLVVSRDGWPDLIDAAAPMLTEDELVSAVYSATGQERVVTGSFLPIYQSQIDFFDKIARDPRRRVKGVGQRLAEIYREQYARAKRREQDDEYRRG
jgi:hypothetical protein